jgi:hypothetical protein
MGLAAALAAAADRSRRGAARTLRGLAVALLLIWVGADGLAGYGFVANAGSRVSPYRGVGQRLAASIEPRATVLGSQRWWWALRAFPYLSLTAQWELWKGEQRAGRDPDFSRMLERVGAVYLILDNDTRGDLTRAPAQLQQQVHDALTRAKWIDTWRDPTYGLIEIYRF